MQCVAVCRRVLQCVAVCCSVLQCVAVCCIVLQCQWLTPQPSCRVNPDTPLCTCQYFTLQHAALHCNTHCNYYYCNILQHTATHCNTLQHSATHCNTLHHTASHCNTLQHTATHRNTPQLTATHRITPQHTASRCNTLTHESASAYILLALSLVQNTATWKCVRSNCRTASPNRDTGCTPFRSVYVCVRTQSERECEYV